MTFPSFTRVLNPHSRKIHKIGAAVYVKVDWNGTRLSITGVEGPQKNRRCTGESGQIVDHLTDDVTAYMLGWDETLLATLQEVWRRWHDNDMRAGSPQQEALIRSRKARGEHLKRRDYDDWCVEVLNDAGLYIDESHLVDGEPYRWGSARLMEPVPDGVLAWLVALPSARVAPDWI